MSLKKVRVELTAWGKYQRFSYYENGYPRINILSGIDEDISDDGHDWLERIETTESLNNTPTSEVIQEFFAEETIIETSNSSRISQRETPLEEVRGGAEERADKAARHPAIQCCICPV